MHQFAREEYDLILLRDHRLIRPPTDVDALFQACVVDTQFSSLELPRFLVEEIDESQVPRRHVVSPVIAVKVEEISVAARGDLRLDVSYGEFFHSQLFEDARQGCLDPLQDDVLVMAQFTQNAGAAMIVVDYPVLRGWREHLACIKIRFVL